MGHTPRYLAHISQYAFEIAFIFAVIAMLGSLYYSDVAGFAPCALCWWQRICMYPLTILLSIAIWRRDRRVGDYVIIFALLGALFAGYHYMLEWSGNNSVVCSVGSIPCSQRLVVQFGYITIPMMSLTAFLAILAAMQVRKLLHAGSDEEHL
jgi:disulfide bond formation protein DsbB